MPRWDRRAMFGLAALIGLGATVRAKAQPKSVDLKELKKDGEVNVLYHCDFGEPGRFSQMLTNINNHLSVYDFDPFKAKIVIVAHGAGVKFFLKETAGTPWASEEIAPELAQRIAALAKYGVEAYICRITFQRARVSLDKLRNEPFVKVVPSGVAAVGDLQAKGFAYLKVG